MYAKYAFSRLLSKSNQLSRTFSTGVDSIPKLPDFDFTPDQTKCHLSAYEISEIHKLNLNPSLKTLYKKPVIITQGRMQYVYDSEGNRYLDMFGGIVTTSVGHCHPKLVDAVSQQLNKLWHVSSIYLHEEVHEYASKLCNRFPEPLSNVFFCNSGSEANDLALLMARLYTGSFDVIALRNAFHGCSPYTMGLCGVGYCKHPIPNNFGIHHTTNPDPYGGRFGGLRCRDSVSQTTRDCSCRIGCACDASNKYIEDLEDLLNTTLPKKIAGFIFEPIQGVGGIVQYPKDYIKRAQQLVKARGGLLIADEVQTGFGRLGSHFWGFQASGVTPDIVTMAKGIGNGFPLSAVVTRPEIAAAINDAFFFNTFGGNPLASRVGSKVLDIIEEEKLQENSRVLGDTLIKGLLKLQETYDTIGDIRGKGLMIGIEMVSNQKKRTSLPKVEFEALLEDMKNMGLLLGRGGANTNVFRITPPMCITEEDVTFTLAVINKALKNHERRS